jgi:hypothetical protein
MKIASQKDERLNLLPQIANKLCFSRGKKGNVSNGRGMFATDEKCLQRPGNVCNCQGNVSNAGLCYFSNASRNALSCVFGIFSVNGNYLTIMVAYCSFLKWTTVLDST